MKYKQISTKDYQNTFYWKRDFKQKAMVENKNLTMKSGNQIDK